MAQHSVTGRDSLSPRESLSMGVWRRVAARGIRSIVAVTVLTLAVPTVAMAIVTTRATGDAVVRNPSTPLASSSSALGSSSSAVSGGTGASSSAGVPNSSSTPSIPGASRSTVPETSALIGEVLEADDSGVTIRLVSALDSGDLCLAGIGRVPPSETTSADVLNLGRWNVAFESTTINSKSALRIVATPTTASCFGARSFAVTFAAGTNADLVRTQLDDALHLVQLILSPGERSLSIDLIPGSVKNEAPTEQLAPTSEPNRPTSTHSQVSPSDDGEPEATGTTS